MKHKLGLAICCGILLAVLAFLPARMNRRVQSAIGDVFSPFRSFIYAGPEFLMGLFRERSGLLDENRRMAIELEKTRFEMTQLRLLEDENRRLRDMLGLARTSGYPLVAGTVVGRDISGWWRKIRVDAGKIRGVEPDMPVVSGSGLVGRTVSVSAHESNVLLLIDPSSMVAAQTRETRAFGIVKGHGVSPRDEAACIMEFISRGAEVNPGDEVVTSGLGGVYPPGLVIGYVRDVFTAPSGLFQEAHIVPSADFRSLDIVFVVLREEVDLR